MLLGGLLLVSCFSHLCCGHQALVLGTEVLCTLVLSHTVVTALFKLSGKGSEGGGYAFVGRPSAQVFIVGTMN